MPPGIVMTDCPVEPKPAFPVRVRLYPSSWKSAVPPNERLPDKVEFPTDSIVVVPAVTIYLFRLMPELSCKILEAPKLILSAISDEVPRALLLAIRTMALEATSITPVREELSPPKFLLAPEIVKPVELTRVELILCPAPDPEIVGVAPVKLSVPP